MPRDRRLYMTVPIDFWQHPKIAPLSDAAFRLWMRSVAWVGTVGGSSPIDKATRTLLGGSARAARELERDGLWQTVDAGHVLTKNGLWSIYQESDAGRKVPTWMREAVLLRDGSRCLMCGRTDDLQMDHIVPWSRGGETTVDNLQPLCGPCNRAKGARV